MTARTTIQSIKDAKRPEDLFGPKNGHTEHATRTYKTMLLEVHPDKHNGTPLEEVAVEATRKLAELYDLFMGNAPTPVAAPIIVQQGKQKFVVGKSIGDGDIANVYEAAVEPGLVGHLGVVFKIAKNPADNDLLQRERDVLKAINKASSDDRSKRAGYNEYFPQLLDSFSVKGPKTTRTANVLEYVPALRSLERVRQLVPQGLDFRDVVWMFKRVLVAIDFMHRSGFVHGAILPPHVLIHPINHLGRLIGFGQAVPKGEPLRVRSKTWETFYPPEVAAKKPATPALDIFMAARLAAYLMDGQPVPPFIRTFFQGCMLTVPSARPDDAWALHMEFDELLKKHVGPRKYRLLDIPGL